VAGPALDEVAQGAPRDDPHVPTRLSCAHIGRKF
jgi:hypothetical protein